MKVTLKDLDNVLADIGQHGLPVLLPMLQALDSGLKHLSETMGSGILGAVVGGAITGGPVRCSRGLRCRRCWRWQHAQGFQVCDVG